MDPDSNPVMPLLDLQRDQWHALLVQVLRHLPCTAHSFAPRTQEQSGEVRPFHMDELPRALSDLAAAVVDPVRVIETDALRVVVVLRLYAVAFDRSAGTTRAVCLLDAGGPLVPNALLPDAGVRLLNSPQGEQWTFHWLQNWCRRNGFHCEAPMRKYQLRCVARSLNEMARQTLDLRAMRRKIASELRYDPTHWRRAVRLASAAHRVPTCYDYNDALRFADRLDLLEREAPNLTAPWFALAREQQIDLDLEPKAALKKWVRATGASARAWRSLAASPSRVWMGRAGRVKCPAQRHLAETVLLIDRFETSVPVPPRIVNAATARLDLSVDQLERLKGTRANHYSSALRAAKWAIENDAWPRFGDEFDAVDLWFDWKGPQLDKLQRQRGWQWLVRKARAWADRERRRLSSQELLIASLPSLSLAGYEFKAARNSFELWDAGRQLRNCLGEEESMQIVQEWRSLLVLATRESDGRVVAAIQLRSEQRGPGLCVRRANGFANGPLSAPIAALLKQVVAHFEALRVCGLLPGALGRPKRSNPVPTAKGLPSTACESNVDASPDCAGSETDSELQRLATRTGFQMAPDDPMRPASTRMELALTKKLREIHQRVDLSAAEIETHELIARVLRSVEGPNADPQ